MEERVVQGDQVIPGFIEMHQAQDVFGRAQSLTWEPDKYSLAAKHTLLLVSPEDQTLLCAELQVFSQTSSFSQR